VEESREKIDTALLLRSSDPFVVSIELEVATAEYVFASRAPRSEQSAETAVSEGKRLAAILNEEFSNYQFGLWRVAEFHTVTEDYEQALACWKKLITEFDSSSAIFYYLPIAFLGDMPVEIEDELMWPAFFLFVDEPQKALTHAETSEWRTSGLGRAWKPNLLRWCGRDEEADASLREARPLADSHAWWVSNVVKIFAGEIGEAEMLEACKGSRDLQTHLRMTLALHLLAQPERRQAASGHVDEALSLDCRNADTYYWCQMLRRKLDEDPAWPESLKKKLQEADSR
jgi:tetratricopeptide (TPR) repeat protein